MERRAAIKAMCSFPEPDARERPTSKSLARSGLAASIISFFSSRSGSSVLTFTVSHLALAGKAGAEAEVIRIIFSVSIRFIRAVT